MIMKVYIINGWDSNNGNWDAEGFITLERAQERLEEYKVEFEAMEWKPRYAKLNCLTWENGSKYGRAYIEEVEIDLDDV